MEKSKKSWIPPELNILLKAAPGEGILAICKDPGTTIPNSVTAIAGNCSWNPSGDPNDPTTWPVITECLYDTVP